MRALLGDVAFARNAAHIEGVLAGGQQEFERELTKPDASVGFALEQYVPDLERSGVVVGFTSLQPMSHGSKKPMSPNV